MRVRLDSGVEASAEEKTEGIDTMEYIEDEVDLIANISSQLHDEMSGLRKTGGEEHAVSAATTTRVIVFGVISVAIIIVSAFIQIWYLRGFFRERKIM